MKDHSSKIMALMKERGIQVASPIISKDAGEGEASLIVNVFHDADGRQQPSNVRLSEVRAELEREGLPIRFILRRADQDDLEGGLRATLLSRFGADVRNAFLSGDRRDAQVWIEPKTDNLSRDMCAVHDLLKVYFEAVNIPQFSINLTNEQNLPSRTAVLSVIRVQAPVAPENIASELVDRGFVIPSPNWLSRILDSLRKASLVVRRSDGKVVLSSAALGALGSGKGRNSPDVRRILDLARRKS